MLVEVDCMGYIFNKGHQISLFISSSNYKRCSVNYNNGNFVIDGDKDYKIANDTVYSGKTYLSQLILPVVQKTWLDQRKVES